ncbi:MAG TPA: hypothetical protein VJ741_06125 [Solirubrobacteraceae bacterium]|nr:hypothetical protein [Solirubrobacteraceae bacterium]
MSARLERVEQIIDASGIAGRIEALLPVGVRPRQLRVRTLLVGMVLTMLAGRDALLTNVLEVLLALPEADRRRLGVSAQWNDAEHQLTYRQLEYTYRLIVGKLSKRQPDGTPSEHLSKVLNALLEASVTVLGEPASSSYAIDWTDQETWSRPLRKQPAASQPQTEPTADHGQPAASDTGAETVPPDPKNPDKRERRRDREASWGHRTVTHPANNEAFFGYYLQAVTAVKDEHGPEVPELARRMHLASCQHDPPAQIVPIIQRMAASGINLADVLVDSGYSYRQPQTFALPIRQLGASLIMDLHPNDRGTHGTHHGAICANGNLYCPATPTTLLELGPLPRPSTLEQADAHDRQCAELARYKLSPVTGYDNDGYRRVICPAAQGKLRCPLRPQSLTLPHQRPTIPDPPQPPPTCCTQKTITVPPSVNTKTAQKHDYPSREHRHSYHRRTAAERTFATLTDRATNDLTRGWCRLTGLTSIALFIATAFIARNTRIADAFHARQADNQRRAANGLPPKQRKRRRQTTQDLIDTAKTPP